MTIRARYPRVYRYKMITTALNAITRLLQDKVLRKEKVVVCVGSCKLKLGFPAKNETFGPVCLGCEAALSFVSLSMLKAPFTSD